MNATIDYDREKSRLILTFPYNPRAVASVKDIAGRRYLPPDKGGPAWSLPPTLDAAERTRAIFGDRLRLTDDALQWGREEARKRRNLLSISGADDAELNELPDENPELFKFISGRTYQRADVAFMAQASSINANQPGLGKTVEVIAAIYESGLINGAHLVVAPVTSLRSVWEPHFRRFCGDEIDIFVAQGPMRDAMMGAAIRCPNAFVLLTNPDTIRRFGEEVFAKVQWDTVTIDEFHKSGLPNTKTKFFKNMKKINASRKWALSGTPVGGKPEKLWAALHFIEPKAYSSKWAWIARWLDTKQGAYGWEVGGIKEGLEEAFYESLRPHMIRRTKDEVAKDLPPKQYVDLWLEMSPTQAVQYEKFARDAEIRIDEEHLSATNVLAEYTRLKQFANARCEVRNINGKLHVVPTFDSIKLETLFENLGERGIAPGDDAWGTEKAVVASQFAAMCRTTYEFLTSKGIPCAMITGATKLADRERMVREFQADGGPRVMILSTTAGGVAITLDQADSLHELDETWVPDDSEQLEDRIHRISRIHQVTIYKYRSKGTIERYITERTYGKAITNHNIMDLRRQGLIRAI